MDSDDDAASLSYGISSGSSSLNSGLENAGSALSATVYKTAYGTLTINADGRARR